MKTKLLPILRYIVLALLLLCIVLCRFFPVMAEGYARHIYPWLSAALSAIASVFPFSLEEALVCMKKDKLIMDTLGEHVTGQYIAGKEAEWEEYCTRVSSWERDKYMINY